jgi:hypothetical protein
MSKAGAEMGRKRKELQMIIKVCSLQRNARMYIKVTGKVLLGRNLMHKALR